MTTTKPVNDEAFRAASNCPPWCTLPGHRNPQRFAENYPEDMPIWHKGLTFGLIEAEAIDERDARSYVGSASYAGFLDADGLRQLAADALVAAEWVEEQS